MQFITIEINTFLVEYFQIVQFYLETSKLEFKDLVSEYIF